MKKLLAALIISALSASHAIAGQCLARKDARTFAWVSDTEIDFYSADVNAVMKTSMCHKPIIGDIGVSYQSATGDLYNICAGDRVVVTLNGSDLFQCQILSIEAK